MMALDLAQFFPSINHSILTLTLKSQGFNPLLIDFFSNFLSDWHTTYHWNSASSPHSFLNSVGVPQGEVPSPMLANLAIAPILHTLFFINKNNPHINDKTIEKNKNQNKNHNKNKNNIKNMNTIPLFSLLPPNMEVLFFMDDSTFLAPSSSFYTNCINIQQTFHCLATLLFGISIVIKLDKTDLTHFYPSGSLSNLPSFHVCLPTEPTTLITIKPKNSIQYLGFFLDSNLNFKCHITFYSNSSLSLALSCVLAPPLVEWTLATATFCIDLV